MISGKMVPSYMVFEEKSSASHVEQADLKIMDSAGKKLLRFTYYSLIMKTTHVKHIDNSSISYDTTMGST